MLRMIGTTLTDALVKSNASIATIQALPLNYGGSPGKQSVGRTVLEFCSYAERTRA